MHYVMIPAIFPKFYMIYRYRDIVLIKFIQLKLMKRKIGASRLKRKCVCIIYNTKALLEHV